VLRFARHLVPVDTQSANSVLILITSDAVEDSVQSKTRLFLSFQTSQMTRSASERVAFLGMFGRDVLVAHHLIGDEEEGQSDGVSFGSPSQIVISAHTRHVYQHSARRWCAVSMVCLQTVAKAAVGRPG
jgi:hypothetical protein